MAAYAPWVTQTHIAVGDSYAIMIQRVDGGAEDFRGMGFANSRSHAWSVAVIGSKRSAQDS